MERLPKCTHTHTHKRQKDENWQPFLYFSFSNNFTPSPKPLQRRLTMAKAVVYARLAAAVVIFIIIARFKQPAGSGGLHLSRRLGYKFRNFDPLVEKRKRIEEARGLPSGRDGEGDHLINHLERNQQSDVKVEDEDHKYFSDEGKLNITLRLLVLFPFLDKAPKDGLVSFEELEAWNREQAIDRLHYRTLKEMESRDKDGDAEISFSEYFPQFSIQDPEKNDMGHGEAGWWKEQYKNADFDGNGTLNFEEFNNFLHPEDSKNEEIQKWLAKEQIKRMDDDQDGKLNLVEFSKHAYGTYRVFAGFEKSGELVPTAIEKFNQLDVDNNGFLDVKELIPILSYLKPGEFSYAKCYTSYLISEADDDGDGSLTLDEMLNHEYTFYSTLYDDNHEDYDHFHDEF